MKLTQREKIGQRLVVGFVGTTVTSELKELIKEYKVANIILFRHNVENARQLKKLCGELQYLIKKYTRTNAFIAIDQEGGMVTRLDEKCVNVPGAMAIAATRNINNAYNAGKMTAKQLKEVGVNFNLAPTVDINSNINNPVIGVRSYGDSPNQVADFSVAMTKGLLEGGVMATAKHFPGHGDTNVDSHLGLPIIDKTLEELEQCELIPFVRNIEEGIPAIMTTHILFPKLEEENIPATMSRTIVTGLLKEKLGFKGLIVSDCMEMGAIQKFYGTVEGVKAALKAGVDLIFISHTAELAKKASDELIKCWDKGEICEEEIEESIQKISAYKEKYIKEGTNEEKFNLGKNKQLSYDMLKQTITPVQMPTDVLPKLGENPLFIGPTPFRATNVSNTESQTFSFAGYMQEYLGGSGKIMSSNPNEEEVKILLKDANKHSCIVIGTYNGHLYKGQLEVVSKAVKLNQKVITVALRNPYDLNQLPCNVYGIAAYEYTRSSLEILGEILKNNVIPTGMLPVKI